MKRMLLALVISVTCFSVFPAQKGAPRSGFYPQSYTGDTRTGEVTAVNDATREITLVYVRGNKSRTFIGVLDEGYTVKMLDGTSHVLKVSEIPIGTRLTAYYIEKEKKIESKKVKINSIIRLKFLPRSKKKPNDRKQP